MRRLHMQAGSRADVEAAQTGLLVMIGPMHAQAMEQLNAVQHA